ncbi:MAG: hypothetical protein M8357_13435 [Desulfobulbaceae bacterium]|nr:hypothetical protein [Desulfobulbaceae bacterium]
MLGKSAAVAILILTTAVLAGKSAGASCLTGTCHQSLTATKYLHGPVAAEQAGATGCVACHVPAGKTCTANSKGSFKPLAPSLTMCRLCHSRGTGTQHSSQQIDCLKCHNPHGSNKNAELQR